MIDVTLLAPFSSSQKTMQANTRLYLLAHSCMAALAVGCSNTLPGDVALAAFGFKIGVRGETSQTLVLRSGSRKRAWTERTAPSQI